MPGNKTGAQLQSVGLTQAPWLPARLCEAGTAAALSLGEEPHPLTAAGCQPPLSAGEGGGHHHSVCGKAPAPHASSRFDQHGGWWHRQNQGPARLQWVLRSCRTARGQTCSCSTGFLWRRQRREEAGRPDAASVGLVGADPPHREPVPGRRHWAGQRGEKSRKVQKHFVVAAGGLLGGASELRGWDRDRKQPSQGDGVAPGQWAKAWVLSEAPGPWALEDRGGDTLVALRPGQPVLQETVVEAVQLDGKEPSHVQVPQAGETRGWGRPRTRSMLQALEPRASGGHPAPGAGAPLAVRAQRAVARGS